MQYEYKLNVIVLRLLYIHRFVRVDIQRQLQRLCVSQIFLLCLYVCLGPSVCNVYFIQVFLSILLKGRPIILDITVYEYTVIAI